MRNTLFVGVLVKKTYTSVGLVQTKESECIGAKKTDSSIENTTLKKGQNKI